MSMELTNLKADLKARLKLEDLIRGAGVDLKPSGKNLEACCPFHAENTPSFKVHADQQYFKCFGCGASGDVFDWLGFQKFKRPKVEGADFVELLREACQLTGIAFPENGAKPTPAAAKQKTVYATREKLDAAAAWQAGEGAGTVAATYAYSHPDSAAVELVVYRIEIPGKGKRFLQARPCEGGFAFGGLERTPIYNRARVAKADHVVIVEGEKCVHALHAIGIVGTTSAGGSNAAEKADWSPLAGKRVTIWRDNDDSGSKYQQAVITALEKLSPRPIVSVVAVEALPLGAKEDCADFIARLPYTDQKREAVDQVLADAVGTGAIADLDADLADAIAGRRIAIPFPWKTLNEASLALLPGSVSVLCGSPGATKSLALIQCLLHWQAAGVPAAALMLEDGVSYHLRRALAQLSNESSLTRDDWCREHPENVATFRAAALDRLNTLQAYLFAPTDTDALTPKALVTWVQARADAGARVICVDPITAMQKGKFGWQDDQQFLMEAKRIVERAKASLLLVSHPRKQAQGRPSSMGLEEIAGGAAYERFAQSILFLRAHRDVGVNVVNSGGEKLQRISNRTLSVLKSRNSYGQSQNVRIAFQFESQSLTLHELGRIVSEAPAQ